MEALYNHYNKLNYSQNNVLDLIYGKTCTKKDILKYLTDNFSEEQIYQKINNLENKENLFKKLTNNITEFQMELLIDYFKDISHTHEELIRYLADNYSESEINNIIKHLIEVHERKEELYNTLTDNQLKLLSNK